MSNAATNVATACAASLSSSDGDPKNQPSAIESERVTDSGEALHPSLAPPTAWAQPVAHPTSWHGYVRHTDFAPGERSRVLRKLSAINPIIRWHHFSRESMAIFESLEMLWGCQNSLLLSAATDVVVCITVITSYTSTRAVAGIVRAGYAPQILARGRGLGIAPVSNYLVPFVLHGGPAMDTTSIDQTDNGLGARVGKAGSPTLLRPPPILPSAKVGSAAIFHGPGTPAEHRSEQLFRTAMVCDAVAVATRAAAGYADFAKTRAPPIAMVIAGSVCSQIWPAHRAQPTELLHRAPGPAGTATALGMWSMSATEPTATPTATLPAAPPVSVVRPLRETAPEASRILRRWWETPPQHVTTFAVAPKSYHWRLNPGIRCHFEVTLGKVCELTESGAICERRTLDSTKGLDSRDNLESVKNFLEGYL